MPEQNKSLLEAMKEYVLQYPNLGDIDLHIDQTESEPVNYSIQTSGLVKLSEDVCGNRIKGTVTIANKVVTFTPLAKG